MGKAKTCNFADKPDFQTCSMDVKGVTKIKLRAIKVYVGQKGRSLALAEVQTDSKS